MTQNDRMEIALRAIAENGQAAVARRIGRSAGLVNRLVKGSLDNPEPVLELIAAAYSGDTVDCPVMGEVPLSDCLDARKRLDMPFVSSSRQAADLRRQCPDCPQRQGGRQ